MKNWENEIKQKLENLEDVPERNPLKVQSMKRNFMSEARKISSQHAVVAPTRSWWNQIFQKKETFPMKLVTIGVILSLLLGGGISAVAAQSSLPGDILYPVKTLVEDLQLELTNNPETQFELGYTFANQRFTEIHELIEAGELPPEPFYFKFQLRLQETLEAALETSDPTGNLLKVQQLLQNQHQTMQMNRGEDTGPNEYQHFVDYKLQYYIEMIDAGIEEPELLSNELQFMVQYSKQYGDEKLEDAWMYMYGSEDPDGLVGEVQNQGEETKLMNDFEWMHQNGEVLSEVDPEQFRNFGEDKNSTTDHLNAGDNENGNNGNNGGAGGNGGNGGK